MPTSANNTEDTLSTLMQLDEEERQKKIIRLLRKNQLDVEELCTWIEENGLELELDFINELGSNYSEGTKGFKRNKTLALKLYELAADYGLPSAASSCAILYRDKF